MYRCALGPAIGRIHENHVELTVRLVPPLTDILLERIAMEDLRAVDVMQQHVGNAQQIGQLLLLDAVNRSSVKLAIFRSPHLGVEDLEGARQEAARAAGEVSHGLAELGGERLGHEVRHSARRIELASVSCRLQVLENCLVNLTEGMALLVFSEVHRPVDLVDDLAQQDTILHVVVGIGEGRLDDNMA